MGKITSEDQLCLTCKKKVIKMIDNGLTPRWTWKNVRKWYRNKPLLKTFLRTNKK